eukprot:10321052-Ditylum_brightwellii.AAC.1
MTAEVLPLPILINRYEALDKKISQLMLAAEKKCQKATPGHAWSLQLVKAARKAQYWKTRLSLERNRLLITDYLRKLELSLDINHQPTSITELQSRLHLAKRELIDAQKRSDIP